MNGIAFNYDPDIAMLVESSNIGYANSFHILSECSIYDYALPFLYTASLSNGFYCDVMSY